MEPCKKVIFKTPREAQLRANEINEANKENNNKVKLRPYRCKVCKEMHLTSMSKRLYDFVNKPEAREESYHKKFVRIETEYWEKKFKIEY